MHTSTRLVATALFVVCSSACRAVEPASIAETADTRAVRETIERLYDAFCFDGRVEPDWNTQREIYLPNAVFVPPAAAGRQPVAEDLETFLGGFRDWVLAGEYAESGLHERIVGLRVDAFGGVAHAFVAFEGFRPGEELAVTRGLDSIQLARDGEAWRLVSFATQYEGEGRELPPRFVDPR